MRLNVAFGLTFAVAGAAALWGCGEGQTQVSPVSPSSLASRSTLDTRGAGIRLTPRYVDSNGDGYDDGPAPEEMPNPEGGMPNPEGVPLPDQVAVPVPLTVNIIGPSGAGAFVPNPLQAALGDTIVWVNADLIEHDIVLDDGTVVGALAPGQSSPPISFASSTMSYHCTLHPSMVGQVTAAVPGESVPPDQSQNPLPDPSGYVPSPTGPSDGGYSDDGYEDDYYLKSLSKR